MYVPDLRDITERNHEYRKNEDTGMFDTRDSAQIILQSMAEAHGAQLKDLPQQLEGGEGRTLLDLCTLSNNASHVRGHVCFVALHCCNARMKPPGGHVAYSVYLS